MKPLVYLFFTILFPAFVFSAEKGDFVFQVPISLTNFGYVNQFYAGGYGFQINKYNHDNYETKHLSFGVAPKFGYTITNNFIVGINSKYWKYLYNYDNYFYDDNDNEDHIKYRTYSLGAFSKLYVGHRKIKPFIEAEINYGQYQVDDNKQGGGGYWHDIETYNFKSVIGNVGLSYFITPKISLDAYFLYQHLWFDVSGYRVENGENNKAALMFSVSFFL